MNQDSRGLLAVVASALFFVVWFSFISPRLSQPPKKELQKEAAAEKAKNVAPAAEKTHQRMAVETSEVEEVTATLENDYFSATFTNYGAVPIEWRLKKYRAAHGDGLVNLVPVANLLAPPLGLVFEKSDAVFPENPKFRLIDKNPTKLVYRWSSEDWTVTKTYAIGSNGYDVDLSVVVENKRASALTQQLSLGWSSPHNNKKRGGFLSFLKQPQDLKTPLYLLDGHVKRKSEPGAEKSEEETGRLQWVGVEERYFVAAVLPRVESDRTGVRVEGFGGEEESAGFAARAVMSSLIVPPGGREEYLFTVYAGPKEMEVLKSVGMGLEKTINHGWFAFLAVPILHTLKFLYSVVHNYGVAIILLTILVRGLLYPISKKSMKSMKSMQQLQPRLKEIREKFKDNRERLNMEMMQLFKNHNVNPMSGCLPMVLQFPVYIALYRVLWNSIELYQAPFFWFYKDLSQPDPYFITPVLLGIAMFLQQKLTPTATADPMQQKMMMLMPLMFSVFLIFLPVGLVVYILVSTLMSVGQQWMNQHDIRLRDLLRGRVKLKKA